MLLQNVLRGRKRNDDRDDGDHDEEDDDADDADNDDSGNADNGDDDADYDDGERDYDHDGGVFRGFLHRVFIVAPHLNEEINSRLNCAGFCNDCIALVVFSHCLAQ